MVPVELSIEEKVGQLFMVGMPGTAMNRETTEFINQNNSGFVILFSRNIESINQLVDLTNELHSLSRVAPFIFVDQEGGPVVQLKEMASTVVSHMALAATGNPENARTAARIIGSEMRACGFDGVLAPVLDVNFEERNPIIGIRSFSDSPDVVADFGGKFYQGLRESGVAGCGKHFPGHGGTAEDSHLGIPVVGISRDVFFDRCVRPFRTLIRDKIDALMTAHVLFKGISDEIATFSPFLVGRLLREELGFQGVVISDCLEMKAVRDHFSAEEIVRKALEAGIDVLTVSRSLDFQKELHRILVLYTQRGRISEKRIDQSLERIRAFKKRYGLLEERDKKTAGPVRRLVNRNRSHGQKLADQSVTLLRNRKGVIPIGADKEIVILEWQKVKATQSLSEAEEQFMLWRGAGEFYQNVQARMLGLDGSVPRNILAQLVEFDFVIAGLYSRTPEMERIQATALKQVEKIRPDVIAVSLGNPYDIKQFGHINTCILTYGFRDIQIRALFKVIRGDLAPVGKLPVRIQDLDP